MRAQTYQVHGNIPLESGEHLVNPQIAYHIWGQPREDGANIVWVCHALTASSDVFSWWQGLFGESDFFNPKDWCIVSANILGSCYGTSGPLSKDANTGEKYYADFPQISVRDMVRAHQYLAQHLKIDRIGVLIGGSLGGQQALEWAVEEPDRFDFLIPIATNAVHSPWGIALNESQRQAIEADSSWPNRSENAGLAGMRVARGLALISYRNYQTYGITQPREPSQQSGFRAATYQAYQGEKLAKRFNAFSYFRLSQAMDSHDLSRGRGSMHEVLEAIKACTLVISIEGDILFPEEEQKLLVASIPGAYFIRIPSTYGHDGFLIETLSLSQAIQGFISKTKKV